MIEFEESPSLRMARDMFWNGAMLGGAVGAAAGAVVVALIWLIVSLL